MSVLGTGLCPHLCRLLLFLELCPPWRKALVKGDHAVPACPVAGVLFIGHPSGLNELASLSHDLAPVIKAKTGHDDRVGRLEGYRPVPDAGHIGQGAFVVKIHEQMPVGLKQPGHGMGRKPVVKGQKLGQVIQSHLPGLGRRLVPAGMDSHLSQTGLFVEKP